jgi:hypothetical protein
MIEILGASVLGGNPVALVRTGPDTYVTSGLFSTKEFGYELIFNGPPAALVAELMCNIVQAVFKGDVIIKDQPDCRFTNMPIMFKDCNQVLTKQHQDFAKKIYYSEVPFVQVVFPDNGGVLPGQPGCDPHLFELQEFFCDIR